MSCLKRFFSKQLIAASVEEALTPGQCALPSIDPWGEEIRVHLDPSYDPNKYCRPTFERITRVKDGRIIVDPKYNSYICEFR